MNIPLTVGNDDIDDTSATNLAALRGLAQRLVAQHAEELEEFATVGGTSDTTG